MPINQPSNQIKFTNVSIVRLKKGKKRFELACYKNKLLEYRSGAEKDLDNVLQVPTIFLSVSKAQTAPSSELVKAFGADVAQDEIRQEILRRGEIQVGERERKEVLERVEKEVLDIVSGRLIDPTTKRVYPPGIISKALDQLSSASGQQQSQGQSHAGEEDRVDGKPSLFRKPLWTGVVSNKPAKSQALEAMKALIAWQPIPVMRAQMRLRVTCPVSLLKQPTKVAGEDKSKDIPSRGSKQGKKGGKPSKKIGRLQDSDAETPESDTELTKIPGNVKSKILSYIESIESQEVIGEDEWEVVGFADPGAFRGLNEFVGNETRGRGRIEVLDMSVKHEE